MAARLFVISPISPHWDPGIALLRVEALLLAGRSAETMDLVAMIEKENAAEPQVLLAAGMLLMRMEKFTAAEQVLSNALAKSRGRRNDACISAKHFPPMPKMRRRRRSDPP